MKRNLDKLRELLEVAEGLDKSVFRIRDFPDISEEESRHHLQLLVDAGYLRIIADNKVDAWVGPTSPVVRPTSGRAQYLEITAAGHDYLGAIRDAGIWAETKRAVAETGGSATLDIVKAIATGFLKKKIEQHTGVPL